MCEEGYVAARMVSLDGTDLGVANLNYLGAAKDPAYYTIHLCMLKRNSSQQKLDTSRTSLPSQAATSLRSPP